MADRRGKNLPDSLRQSVNQIEANPQPAHVSDIRREIEAFPDARQILRGDALPVIVDVHTHPFRCLRGILSAQWNLCIYQLSSTISERSYETYFEACDIW